MLKRLLSGCLLFLFIQTGFALPSSDNNATTEYCPQVSDLILKDMWWGAPHSWRSYSRSFVRKISDFVGAQWVGVNVGVIICIYQGANANDFPVTIQRSTIVPLPKGGSWILKKHAGHIDCYSNQVTDCPFVVEKSVTPSTEQVNQTLDSIHPPSLTKDNP